MHKKIKIERIRVNQLLQRQQQPGNFAQFLGDSNDASTMPRKRPGYSNDRLRRSGI
jgi:hypothetical protein